MTSTTPKANYFNLHTSGIGYLNNIRKVTPKKGDEFLACRIAALVGESSNPEYRYFDCRVVGDETIKLITRCENAVNANKKVLIAFKLADIWVDSYVVSKDTQNHKKGDTAFSLKGRLIRVSSITIDGEQKYKETQINE